MSLKLQILWVFTLFAAVFLPAFQARGEATTNQTALARAESTQVQAWENYQADTNSAAAAFKFARATYDVAELATNDAQRAEVARRGIAVCRKLLEREPDSAPAHYYLGMNLGKLAQAEAPSLTAYRLVHEVESEFKAAASLNVRFDYAGPARTLGQLYFQAPGWPLSVGSKSKAREWLERAAELAPDYPPNQLNLAEAQFKWRQREELELTLKKMEAIWPMARTNFVGDVWKASWLEWNDRRAAVESDYQRVYGGKQ